MRPTLLIPQTTHSRLKQYLADLQDRSAQPGVKLTSTLRTRDLATLTTQDLTEALLDTKSPQIFAESEVVGDGSDWTLTELRLLGDLSISVDVTVFDDGRHQSPQPHARPFPATLVYVPGALLRHGSGGEPADLAEVTSPDGALCPEGYYQLYERRLFPVFEHINRAAHDRQTPAFVTIPGLGCGQFAGRFQGRLGQSLQNTLERFLKTHGEAFEMIQSVYYDPYDECTNQKASIHGISFRVRPLARGNAFKPQLCPPPAYAENDEDDFSHCQLYSLVAWDHVSWPGNDFFAGSRCTDDGVKAAATDSMHALTGIQGSYDRSKAAYLPPKPHRTWAAAVRTHGIKLSARCILP